MTRHRASRLTRLFVYPAVLAGIACSTVPGVQPPTNDRNQGLALTLNLDQQSVFAGDNVRIVERFTNTLAKRREGYLHFPRVLRFRNSETGEEWLIQDTSIHDICAEEDRFVLKGGAVLSRSRVRRVPNLAEGEYAVVSEITVAECEFSGSTPVLRWTIKSAPVLLRVATPEASARSSAELKKMLREKR